MDEVLIRYLNSGRAWLLIGSGPSTDMGYPSWGALAEAAIAALRSDQPGADISAVESAYARKKYPDVFERTGKMLGSARLRQVLQANLEPTRPSKIYEMIARWPVPVFLTTNYDDELQKYLAKAHEAYLTRSNSEDHFSQLVPDLSGVVVKLHGDLTSDSGLVLTTSHYREVLDSPSWQYWRTRMTSIFQMNRVIVIGHSLSDPNIRHVLAAAQGAGVEQPVCWVAPDVTPDQRRSYLAKYRIRVISYDNRDGEHKNLLRLIQNIDEFIVSRTTIGIQDQIARVAKSPLGDNSAAPGFFVFNRLSAQGDYESKRIEIVMAALQSTVLTLADMQPFSLQSALEVAGWPPSVELSPVFSKAISDRATIEGLLERSDDLFVLGTNTEAQAAESKKGFDLLRERFKLSLTLRLKRDYPNLNESQVQKISNDIEASLTGFFREGGLTLATTVFANTPDSRAKPISIIKFVMSSADRYDTLLMRQAFATVTVAMFSRAEQAERDYLGRVVQGYFAFHALGVFGEVAIERLKQVKETVWLVDSNAQITALALASPTNAAFVGCFVRLRDANVRLFTTRKLFEETWNHFWFANNLVKRHGPSSADVISAAKGQAPYDRSNEFLGGSIRWQEAGHSCDWQSYLFQVFGQRIPSQADAQKRLADIGIEVVAIQDWPGFSDAHYHEAQDKTGRIVGIREERQTLPEATSDRAMEMWGERYRKAEPEAEAFVIVQLERTGEYYIISERGVASPSWFISGTSILNMLEPPSRITWQPEVFLRFMSALSLSAEQQDAERAFEGLLWACAQSGLSLIDETTIGRVFGGVIDQDILILTEEKQIYDDTLNRYGESPEDIIKRLPPSQKSWAAMQLAQQANRAAEERRSNAEADAASARRRAEVAETELSKVGKYRERMRTEEERAAFRKQKQRQKTRKKGDKKRKR